METKGSATMMEKVKEETRAEGGVIERDEHVGSMSDGTGSMRREHIVIHFDKNDPENPYTWKSGKKLFIALTAILLTVNSTISSAITSNANAYIMDDFNVSGDRNLQAFVPTTVYLVGYIFGPLVFGPLSETIGRKPVTFWSMTIFFLFTMASALAPNWPAFLVFRLVCGTCASVPLTVIGGVLADLYDNPRTRGRAMIMFMSGPAFGPLGGPVISGFVTPALGWRWVLWINLIIVGCSWVPMAFVPETYGPVLLKKRAAKLRNKTGNGQIVAPIELESTSFAEFLQQSLARPVSMICFEPLIYLTCLYIAILYAFFYLFFEAYPIVFQNIYNFNRGQCGIALAPIGIGAMFTGPVLIYWDSTFEAARKRGAAWSQKEESHRLPIACLGGPFVTASLFWLAWTARGDIHWAVPCLSGLAFGFGYLLIFTALANYQVDAYPIYAASAMAACSSSRSLVGAVLPLATQPLYDALGIGWATSLLGFLSLGLLGIPFGLIYYGRRIREKSRLCQELEGRRKADEEGGASGSGSGSPMGNSEA